MKKIILIIVCVSFSIIIIQSFIKPKNINRNVDTDNSAIMSIFDKQLLTTEEYKQKWGQIDRKNKYNVDEYNFKDVRYNLGDIKLKFIYPEGWYIKQDRTEISLTPLDLD